MVTWALAAIVASLSGLADAATPPAAQKRGKQFGLGLPLAELRERCSKGALDLAGLLVRMNGKPEYGELFTDRSADEVAFAAACRGAVAGADACGSLQALRAAHNTCRDWQGFAPAAFAAVRGGDAPGTCRRWLGVDAPELGEDVRNRYCATWVSSVQSRGERNPCWGMEEGGAAVGADKLAQCAQDSLWMAGEPARCSKIKDGGERGSCRQRAEFAAAARSPSACDAHPFCAALASGTAGACGGYSAKTAKQVCERVESYWAAAESIKKDNAAEAARQEEARKRDEAKLGEARAARAKREREAAEAAKKTEEAKRVAEAVAQRVNEETAKKREIEREARERLEKEKREKKGAQQQFKKGAPMQLGPPPKKKGAKAQAGGEAPAPEAGAQ